MQRRALSRAVRTMRDSLTTVRGTSRGLSPLPPPFRSLRDLQDPQRCPPLLASARDASQATIAPAPQLYMCIPRPHSLLPTTPLQRKARRAAVPLLRESPQCESARRVWTQTRGGRRCGTRLPASPAPRVAGACSCELLKMAFAVCAAAKVRHAPAPPPPRPPTPPSPPRPSPRLQSRRPRWLSSQSCGG